MVLESASEFPVRPLILNLNVNNALNAAHFFLDYTLFHRLDMHSIFLITLLIVYLVYQKFRRLHPLP